MTSAKHYLALMRKAGLKPSVIVFMTVMIFGSTQTDTSFSQGFQATDPRRIPAPEESTVEAENPTADPIRNQHSIKKTRRKKENNRPVSTEKKCRTAFFQYALPLKKIAAEIQQQKQDKKRGLDNEDIDKQISLMMALDANDCANRERRSSMIRLLSGILNKHERKVIVLMPEQGDPKYRAASMFVDSMLAILSQSEKSSSEKNPVISLEIAQSKPGTSAAVAAITKAVAYPYWSEKPALIISLLSGNFDVAAAKVADVLSIPLILAGPAVMEKDLRVSNKRLFRVFPDQSQLAAGLARSACKRGLKTVGILMTNSSDNNAYAKNFTMEFANCGGAVLNGGTFGKAEFQSVDRAVKELLPEFEKISSSVAGVGSQNGPPRGIVVLEDARIARHVAKVVKMNNLGPVTLMGHHKWRSPIIVQPWDAAFEQSFFVDMVGPLAIESTKTQLKGNLDQQELRETVWNLVGRRTGQIVAGVFNSGANYPRRNLHRIMLSMTAPRDDVFTTRTFFNATNEAWWPSYVYLISQGNYLAKPEIIWQEPTNTEPANPRTIGVRSPEAAQKQ